MRFWLSRCSHGQCSDPICGFCIQKTLYSVNVAVLDNYKLATVDYKAKDKCCVVCSLSDKTNCDHSLAGNESCEINLETELRLAVS